MKKMALRLNDASMHWIHLSWAIIIWKQGYKTSLYIGDITVNLCLIACRMFASRVIVDEQ